jgi:mono/diheme cytochrome c family protein
MKLLTILFFLSSLIIWMACGSKQQSVPAGDSIPQTASIDGKTIYNRECILCHGERGDKGVAGSANLTQSLLSLDERIYVIKNGRGIMQPFKNKLTPDEIEAVARYTQELRK